MLSLIWIHPACILTLELFSHPIIELFHIVSTKRINNLAFQLALIVQVAILIEGCGLESLYQPKIFLIYKVVC